jgi:hypothetical protein
MLLGFLRELRLNEVIMLGFMKELRLNEVSRCSYITGRRGKKLKK